MAIFVAVPLILIAVFAFTTTDGSFTLQNFSDFALYFSVFSRSLLLAFIATAICLLIGYPAAYFLSREGAVFKRFVMLLVMLPMWINFLLRTYAWLSLLENNGLINRLLSLLGLPTMQLINTDGAVVLGMVYNFLPFMILPIFSVIDKIDQSMVEAASDLGANTYRVFRRIILPLSLPGVISGITMVFVPSVSTFVISQLLGGGSSLLLGDLIQMQFLGNAYNPHLGSAISLVMMLIVTLCMALMNRFGDGEDEAMLL